MNLGVIPQKYTIFTFCVFVYSVVLLIDLYHETFINCVLILTDLPQNYNTATLVINVTDVNDNAPYFTRTVFTGGNLHSKKVRTVAQSSAFALRTILFVLS